jgi:hypothetical protein
VNVESPTPDTSSAGHNNKNNTQMEGTPSEIMPSPAILSVDIPSGGIHSAKATPSPYTPRSVISPISDVPMPPAFKTRLLKMFGCSGAGIEHITFISNFSNLTSLVLSDVRNCGLTSLKRLKYLRSLALWYSRYGAFL